jgi:hypothetical protein
MPALGGHHTEEAKRRIGEARHRERGSNLGKHFSEEWRGKISKSLRGKKHPHLGMCFSEETRKKISDSLKGERHPYFGKYGKNHPAWRGGSSFLPYCEKFNEEFKERVRAFFGYRCVECGTPQNGRRLSVHHVNFNKMSCCDDTVPLFVSLCHTCHTKTNGKREYSKQHFTEMIEQYYRGKCYLTKEEYSKLVLI